MKFYNNIRNENLTCYECGQKVKATVSFSKHETYMVCIACLANATHGVFQGICKVDEALKKE